MKEFQLRLRRRNIPDAELLVDLAEVAKSLGVRTVTAQQYDEYGQFGKTTLLRRIGPWNTALERAGLEVAHRQNISDDELFENLVDVWTRLGRQPLGREMSEKSLKSKFSLGTYEKRFGSWNKALLAFSDFIRNVDPKQKNQTETNEYSRSVRNKRTPRDVNWRLRARILIRDNCICKMCGASPAKDPSTILHVDHILAWDLGGETTEENLQTLCEPCNIGKSNMTVGN